jgi:two-component system, OmpR family, sensor histidine kinase MprB
MSLRKRLSLVAATAVAVSIVIAAIFCYFVVRHQLRSQVDTELREQAVLVQQGEGLNQPLPGLPANSGGPAPYVQLVSADGTILRREGDVTLPVSHEAVKVAEGQANAFLTDVRVNGSHLRVLTFPIPFSFGGQTLAAQMARPLGPVDNILSDLRLVLLLLCAGGIVLAFVLGRVAARRVLAPLAEVTQTARVIGETDDLSRRIVVHADDEVGQLARRFNQMLERLESSRLALDDSVRAQRQLVADASHELRTPVTSLRTNIEVLLAVPDLDEEERRQMLSDVVEQSEELSALVGDLIELARGDLPEGAAEPLRLDTLVEESIARGHRHSPNIRFVADLQPVVVEGFADRLHRAINNLLDNAAKHSPSDGVVEVTVDAAGVRVRDHGHGIAAEDLPHVFDRFYRGAHSRGTQGSGLGLAIVRQVVTQHGGSVTADNAPDGGAVFTLHLPTHTVEDADHALERDDELADSLWAPRSRR